MEPPDGLLDGGSLGVEGDLLATQGLAPPGHGVSDSLLARRDYPAEPSWASEGTVRPGVAGGGWLQEGILSRRAIPQAGEDRLGWLSLSHEVPVPRGSAELLGNSVTAGVVLTGWRE